MSGHRIERVHLADDGSEHAAWMLHYALRMARTRRPARLQVLHVAEDSSPPSARRLAQHRALAERYEVELVYCELEGSKDVPGALAAHVPPGPSDVVIVGFRAHHHGHGLVFGSVGHALLARHDHAVLAMRVVEPGNMGLPSVLAMGLSESPELELRLLPALELFAPDLDELVLLRVMEVQRRFMGAMRYAQVQALEQRGRAALGEAADVVRAALSPDAPRIDLRATVSDRWPSQLVMDAHRVRAHMLLLGASDHLLPRRFVLSNPLERVLVNAACDVSVFRAAAC